MVVIGTGWWLWSYAVNAQPQHCWTKNVAGDYTWVYTYRWTQNGHTYSFEKRQQKYSVHGIILCVCVCVCMAIKRTALKNIRLQRHPGGRTENI